MIGYMRSAVHRGRKACGSILRPAPRGHTPPTRAGEPAGGETPRLTTARAVATCKSTGIGSENLPSAMSIAERCRDTHSSRRGQLGCLLLAACGVTCQRATSLLSALAACALLGEAIDGWRQERAEFRVSAETLPPPTTLMGPRLLYTRSERELSLQICVFRGGSAFPPNSFDF